MLRAGPWFPVYPPYKVLLTLLYVFNSPVMSRIYWVSKHSSLNVKMRYQSYPWVLSSITLSVLYWYRSSMIDMYDSYLCTFFNTYPFKVNWAVGILHVNIVLLRIFISFSLSCAIRKYCDFNVLNPEKDFHLKVLKSFKIWKVQHLVVLATKINVSMLVQDKVTFLLYICLKLFPQVAFVSIVVRGHPVLHKPVALRHI